MSALAEKPRRLACLLALLPMGTIAAQQSGDTARYVVLFSDRPAGYYKEWWSGGDLHSVFEFNDRGRGPHQEATLHPGPAGLPAALTIVGHNYVKDTVDERLATAGGTVTWQSRFEQGGQSADSQAFYIAAAETPIGSQLLIQAALKKGGRIALLPSGEAAVERVGELTIESSGRPLHLVQYTVGGLGFAPNPMWLDDTGRHFALVSSYGSIAPEGWELAIPAMVEAQEKARDARFMRLAGELAHRPTGPLVIRHARLFVAESASVRPGATVVVVGNRITAVGSDAQIRIPEQAEVIDAAGKTLLPGLWDMHVHISPGEDGLLHIAAGVTSARDMGNDTVMTLVLQRRFASDSLIGPRLMLSGLIDGSGPFQVPLGVLADDSIAARRAVEWYAAHGYEQIKVYSSMKPELVPGIIAAAHARGLAEHGAELDFASQRVRDFVSLLKARGTDIDPTLVAFEDWFTARPGQLGPSETAIADRMPPQVRRTFYAGGLPVPSGKDQRYRDSYGAMLRMVKAMYDAGVPIVAGTDAAPLGFALFRELELYAQAGIPPRRVIQLATLGAARIMHRDAERGSVAVGKLADLVLVDGDPTQRISDIRRTSLVVKDGIVYRPAELYGALGVKP